jgi:hypothetical protein
MVTLFCGAVILVIAELLIEDAESGINDLPDRDGSRCPIQFHIANDRNRNPVDTQVVQAATNPSWSSNPLKNSSRRLCPL